MIFKITCETFLRLSNAALPLGQVDERGNFYTVGIQNANGQSIGIATTGKIMAVEWLKITDQPDGIISIPLNDDLLKQCEIEAVYNSVLTIENGVITSSLGWSQTFTVTSDIHHYLNEWKNILRDCTTDNKLLMAGMFMNTEHLSALGRSSPTGRIVFPEKIYSKRPVMVVDATDKNWFGFFIGTTDDGAPVNTSPFIPEWIPS